LQITTFGAPRKGLGMKKGPNLRWLQNDF
jgi:hypothetical protein